MNKITWYKTLSTNIIYSPIISRSGEKQKMIKMSITEKKPNGKKILIEILSIQNGSSRLLLKYVHNHLYSVWCIYLYVFNTNIRTYVHISAFIC